MAFSRGMFNSTLQLMPGTGSTTYTTSDVFTVPYGVTSLTVECIGGGGCGGSTGTTTGGGGGGGGGAYAKSVISVSPGETYTVNVGNGGQFFPFIVSASSSFVRGVVTHVLAARGLNSTARPGAAGGKIANSIGTVKYAGGNGASGTTSNGGGGGGAGGRTANGGNASESTGGTGNPPGGNGANGSADHGTGASGLPYGGGGAGACKESGVPGAPGGGSGAAGVVIVTW